MSIKYVFSLSDKKTCHTTFSAILIFINNIWPMLYAIHVTNLNNDLLNFEKVAKRDELVKQTVDSVSSSVKPYKNKT